MRKLLLAFALFPAVSQAALVIDNGKHAVVVPPPLPIAAAATTAPSLAPTIAPPDSTPSGVTTPQTLTVAPVWAIEPTDLTFQALFTRWARIAGWTFLWDVEQDIPLVGRDTLNTSFTDAVLTVSHSTDSTDLPVHPCFYKQTPPLVRIVPISVACNPETN